MFVYNHASTVRAALDSILSQQYDRFEILVLDDASTDHSIEILTSVVNSRAWRVPVRIISNRYNQGFNRQIHRAVNEARGALIVEADGDDISHPTRLMNIALAWLKYGKPEAFIFSAFYTLVDGKVNTPPVDYPAYAMDLDSASDLRRLSIPLTGSTSAWTPGLVRKLTHYSTRIKHQDAIFPLRALLLSGKIIYLSTREVTYTLANGSLSRPVRNSFASRVENNKEYWRGMIAVCNQYAIDRVSLRRGSELAPSLTTKLLDDKIRAIKEDYLFRYACLKSPIISIPPGFASRLLKLKFLLFISHAKLLKSLAYIERYY
jgi:glycosyltransferase involved in cell wall biosynthesis